MVLVLVSFAKVQAGPGRPPRSQTVPADGPLMVRRVTTEVRVAVACRCSETLVSLDEGPATGHGLGQPFFCQDVDRAAYGADGQAGLLGQVRDRR